jgi:hypothetical protein
MATNKGRNRHRAWKEGNIIGVAITADDIIIHQVLKKARTFRNFFKKYYHFLR